MHQPGGEARGDVEPRVEDHGDPQGAGERVEPGEHETQERRAGVSRATMFSYFGSKKALLLEYRRRLDDELASGPSAWRTASP